MIEILEQGPNTLTIGIGDKRIYFSHKTPIAFYAPGYYGLVVRENDWSTTTGKHLNAIDGGGKEAKANRLRSSSFESALATAFK